MFKLKYTGWNEQGEQVCTLKTEDALSQAQLGELLDILEGIGVEDISEEPV